MAIDVFIVVRMLPHAMRYSNPPRENGASQTFREANVAAFSLWTNPLSQDA
jgi:hypothetical protein